MMVKNINLNGHAYFSTVLCCAVQCSTTICLMCKSVATCYRDEGLLQTIELPAIAIK